MKRWSILFFFITNAVLVFAQADSNVLIAQADAAYMAGDYETSQALYEAVIQGGFHDFRVYFNLGNAYYQSGDLGHALLNYRRAQAIAPRDADLRDNLARIRLERVDLQGDESGFFEGLAALTIGFFTLSELSILVFLIWLIWFVLLSVAFFRATWRGKSRIPLLVTGIILLIGMLLLVGRLASHSSAIITHEAVQVRSGPGEAYLELYQLHSAAEVYIWKVENDWVQFALPDGRLGWVSSSAMEFLQH